MLAQPADGLEPPSPAERDALRLARRFGARRSRPAGASVAELEALYRERAGAFMRFATAMLGDRELARDVLQDSFASALRRRESFRGQGSVEAWMWSTVANTARNAARSRALRRRVGPAPEVGHADGPEQQLGGDERRVRQLVSGLPERQRACVFLHYFADLDYATIAEVLGIRPGTVAATLNAARKTLRDALEAEI